MLSLKKINDKSVPLCKIQGGKYDGKVVYFDENVDKDNNEIEYNMKINSLIDEMMANDKYFEDLKGANKKKTKTLLREHIIKNIPPIDDISRDRYNRVKNDINNRGNKKIEVFDGEMLPYHNKNKRSIYYICASSGAGKSYFMNQYAKSYKDQNKKNDVILFSKLDDDDTLNQNKSIKRFQINEELVNDPIDAKELSNSLVLFDDTMMINGKIGKELNERLLKDVLEIGRHHNIECCITNHLINEYKKTRPMMNECTHIVLFVKGANKYGITYCLKNYLGLDKNEIQNLFKLPSTRWIMINKTTYPMSVVYQHGCYILGSEGTISDAQKKVEDTLREEIKEEDKKNY